MNPPLIVARQYNYWNVSVPGIETVVFSRSPLPIPGSIRECGWKRRMEAWGTYSLHRSSLGRHLEVNKITFSTSLHGRTFLTLAVSCYVLHRVKDKYKASRHIRFFLPSTTLRGKIRSITRVMSVRRLSVVYDDVSTCIEGDFIFMWTKACIESSTWRNHLSTVFKS